MLLSVQRAASRNPVLQWYISFKGKHVLLDILKIIVTLIGGGAMGALLNDWFRRKSSRLQRIPLIERVNRLVNPELEGITLARRVGDQLEELKNLREYQLTLRNTSTIHLQEVEIQFDFPVEHVQAWAQRPALSKTELVDVPTQPIRGGTRLRWQIPHLPSGDSVEFTFRAVDPPSADYAVALYKNDRIILDKVVGEPVAPKSRRLTYYIFPATMLTVLMIVISLALMYPEHGSITTAIKGAGCSLNITSSWEAQPSLRIPPSGPWRINHRILNSGLQTCIVQSEQLDAEGTFTLGPGKIDERERLSIHLPKLVDIAVSVGTPNITPEESRFNSMLSSNVGTRVSRSLGESEHGRFLDECRPLGEGAWY
jgi:hypothetical protein